MKVQFIMGSGENIQEHDLEVLPPVGSTIVFRTPELPPTQWRVDIIRFDLHEKGHQNGKNRVIITVK